MVKCLPKKEGGSVRNASADESAVELITASTVVILFPPIYMCCPHKEISLSSNAVKVKHTRHIISVTVLVFRNI